jgi:hypothetical protein
MCRLTVISVALLALGAAAPASQAAPSDWIGVGAPKSARTGRSFALKASASFDHRRYAPPRRYLAAGLWRHRGEDACPRAVPIERKGWTRVGTLDFYPRGGLADELSTEFVDAKVTLRVPGIYRHCGYVYEIRYSGTSSRPSYAVQARGSAVTTVRRG